jgi:hypothetical protein
MSQIVKAMFYFIYPVSDTAFNTRRSMNKARRHELKMLKFKKRLIKYGFLNTVGKFDAFRSHGKPCSCWLCRNEKYKRAMVDVKAIGKELSELEVA